jgi:hypothetical protein
MAYNDDVQEFYDAAKAAYLSAVSARRIAHTGTQVSFEHQNHEIDNLRNELEYWSNELDRISAGGGISQGRGAVCYDQ